MSLLCRFRTRAMLNRLPFSRQVDVSKGSLTPLQEDAEEEQQQVQDAPGSSREPGMYRRLSAVVKRAALTARRRSLLFDPGDYVDNSNRPPLQRGTYLDPSESMDCICPDACKSAF
jgi:hypothetical protein